jgi:1-deoxy-D-xylulose-5-phosphate synthase
MRYIKPLDDIMLHEIFSQFNGVITLEDGVIQGGFGSAVIEWMMEQGYNTTVTRMGIDDKWIEHGTQAELYAECGYNAEAIEIKIEEELDRINTIINSAVNKTQSA